MFGSGGLARRAADKAEAAATAGCGSADVSGLPAIVADVAALRTALTRDSQSLQDLLRVRRRWWLIAIAERAGSVAGLPARLHRRAVSVHPCANV